MKAEIETAVGKITVEGSPEEVMNLIKKLENKSAVKKRASKKGKSLSGVLISMIDDNFFNTPKYFGEILAELKRRGYGRYPRTSVHAVIIRDFVRTHVLERRGSQRKYQYILSKKEF